MLGFLEVIAMMLALNGFGVDANPKAAKADAILEYAVDGADAIVYLDVVAVGPRNYKVLVGLPDDAAIKASPGLVAAAKKLKANVEGVRGMAKAVAGLDPVHDVTSVTVFVDVDPKSGPVPLAVVRGTIPADFVKKIASVSGGKTGTIDGRDTLELDPQTTLGVSKNGALIVGPRALVEPRVADAWKPPTPARGSTWATVATHLDARPFFLAALRMDEAAAKAVTAELGKNLAGDLVAGHEIAILAFHHDGFALHWKDRTAAGLDRVAVMIDGVIELMRAAHVAPRGLAKIAIAALPSYAGTSKELDALIKQKDAILKVVESYTGDGQFKVDVKKDAKARTLTVRGTGRSFSEVVPGGVIVGMGVIGFLVAGRAEPVPPTSDRAAPVRPAPPARTAPPKKAPAKKPPSGGKTVSPPVEAPPKRK